MTLYMHTIDGIPARFDPVDNSIRWIFGGRQHVRLAYSLKQIRHEQEVAQKDPDLRYGYVLVKVVR